MSLWVCWVLNGASMGLPWGLFAVFSWSIEPSVSSLGSLPLGLNLVLLGSSNPPLGFSLWVSLGSLESGN